MKKILKIASIVLLAAIAFVPIPSSGNGGTKMYSALTYKFVVWDEKADDCYLDSTEFYFIPKNFWSTDALRDDMIKSGSAIMPYDSEWIEKVDSSKAKGLDFSEITIREIYADCFIASSHRAPPNTYKINCEYTGELCVGDYVSCVCDNTYVHNDRCEGDLVSIKVLEPLPKSDSFVAYKPVIYLYPEEKDYVSVLHENSTLPCLYLYKDRWKITPNLSEIRQMDDIIFIKTDNWEKNKSYVVQNEPMIVFIDSNNKSMINTVLEYTGLKKSEVLFTSGYVTVYSLS